MDLDKGNLADKDKAIDAFSKVQLRLAFKVKVGYPDETMSQILKKVTYLENNSLLIDPKQFYLLPGDDQWSENARYILGAHNPHMLLADKHDDTKALEDIRRYLTDMSTIDKMVAGSCKYFTDTDLLVIKGLVRRKDIESLCRFSHHEERTGDSLILWIGSQSVLFADPLLSHKFLRNSLVLLRIA